MDWKIIFRNGFIGSVLMVAVIMLMPIASGQIIKIFAMYKIDIWNLGFVIVMFLLTLFLLVYIFTRIPDFKGYSDETKSKEVIRTRLIASIVFIITLLVLVHTRYYQSL